MRKTSSNPRKGKVTIYDVAREAGVAISTVSRVLNDSPDVSEPTRRRVLKAVEALRFRPDRVAKKLAQKRRGTVTVAVPSFTSLFYNEMLKGVKDALRKHDMDLLLCNMGSQQPHQTLFRFLNRGAVDALLLFSLPITEELQHTLLTLQAPVVLVGTRDELFDSFYWDEVAGARAATRHLVMQGHRDIGVIVAHTWSFNMESRILGYRQALEEADIPFNPDYIQTGDTRKHAGFSEEAGYEAIHKLLRVAPDITAVFANSDVQAIGAQLALEEAGKRVPEDVALIGFDDIKISRYIGLSSVNLALHAVGFQATERLIQRLKEPELPSVHQKVSPRLMVRKSSRYKRTDTHDR